MNPDSRFVAKRQETTEELLEKASQYLGEIGSCMTDNPADLPAEIYRNRHEFGRPEQLFKLLDLHLRHETLNGFLGRHPSCLAMVAFVFGSAHPRLVQDPAVRRALKAADGTAAEDAAKFLSNKRQRGMQQEVDGEGVWRPKRVRRADGSCVPLTAQQRRAMRAFDEFLTVDDDPRMPPSARGKFLNRAEFALFRVKIQGEKNGKGKPEKGTHLTFTIPPRSSSPEPERLSARLREAMSNDVVADIKAAKGKAAAAAADSETQDGGTELDEEPFMVYNGHMVDSPPTMLSKIKSFLRRPNIERRPDWGQMTGDIQDYLAHLLQIRAEKSWSKVLDEVVDMFRAHTIYDDFHQENPGLDHELWQEVMQPRYTMRPPQLGSEPVKQNANHKSPVKKKDDDTPSPLGDDDELYDDHPITFDNMMIQDAPAEESKDPYNYTRWHNRLRANLEFASDAARSVTEPLTEVSQDDDSSPLTMALPRNFNGPILGQPLLDEETRRLANDWARLRVLYQGVQRAARRSPRPFLDEATRYMGLGRMADRETINPHRGRPSVEMERLRTEEINWLAFLAQPSLNPRRSPEEFRAVMTDWKTVALCKIVVKMATAIAPGGFGDGARLKVDEFLKMVNKHVDGPVKGHTFTMDELEERLPTLVNRNIVSLNEENRARYISRHPGQIHPEDAVHWPEGPPLEEDYTVTAHAAIPSVIPDLGNVRSVQQCLSEKDDIARDAERTATFFCRLAYRLGRTLVDVHRELFRDHLDTLQEPERQAAAEASLQGLMTEWRANTADVSIPQCRNGRPVATYKDVVLAAEPGALRDYEERSEEQTEAYCRALVQRNIVKEASENKTMLWPLPVPRESDVGPVQARDGKTVLRREAPWSFAKTEAGPVRKFFDVNNWPLQVQSEERQASIREPGSDDADAIVTD